MSWNYRIFKHTDQNGNFTYALHEAYYDDNKKLDGWTVEPMTPHRNSVDELAEMLAIQLRDLIRSRDDVLDYNKLGRKFKSKKKNT